MKLSQEDLLLTEDAGYFFDKPLEWAAYAFPWDTDLSIRIVKTPEKYKNRWPYEYGLDEWALNILDEWGNAIKKNNFDGKIPVPAFLSAVSSGHGIGKSTLTSIIILFIMSTRPNCRGMVTANTSDQLKTKTWAELGKWLKKCITTHWFEYNNSKGNMNIYHREYKESWRCDAQTCKEENSESFAGLHSATSSPFYIFDEASAIPDKIWEVAEGGMTDGEPFWFAFGNPTRTTGRFRECFRKFRHRWFTKFVDSRDVQITNKEQINQWANDYGEESDFFKIRVRGVFPSQSVKQFFPDTITGPARGKQLPRHQYEFAAKVITVDPSWEGNDELVIGLGQGLTWKVLKVIPKNDNDVVIAQIISDYEKKYSADAVHIDGGFGQGIISQGRTWGKDWQIVWFSGHSTDPSCINKRAEMCVKAKQWLLEGGCLPDDDNLYSDIEVIETVPRTDGKIQIISKKELKAHGFRSPNWFDSWILMFAFPVFKKETYSSYSDKEDYMCENSD